jgi:hypothetical protein
MMANFRLLIDDGIRKRLQSSALRIQEGVLLTTDADNWGLFNQQSQITNQQCQTRLP